MEKTGRFWYLLVHNIKCSYRLHLTNKQFLFLRVYFKPSGTQIPRARSPRWLNFAPRRLIFVDPRCGIASRHAPGTYNFEVAPGFWNFVYFCFKGRSRSTIYQNLYEFSIHSSLLATSIAASGRVSETRLTEYSKYSWARMTEILQLMITEWLVALVGIIK